MRLCGPTRPFKWKNLASHTQEFAKKLPEPPLGQQRSRDTVDASSLFLWAGKSMRTGRRVDPKNPESRPWGPQNDLKITPKHPPELPVTWRGSFSAVPENFKI